MQDKKRLGEICRNFIDDWARKGEERVDESQHLQLNMEYGTVTT